MVLAKALSGVAFEARKDSQASMARDLDRPKRFTQNAINYERANTSTLTSAVFVNPANDYLHFMVFGGTRSAPSRRILVPTKEQRTDRHGNMPRARRRRIVKSPKTFTLRRGRSEVLMHRKGRRAILVGALPKATEYDRDGYWSFYDEAFKSFDRHFRRKFIAANRRRTRRR